MTKTAIALFGTRVSPRFDCAPAFRVVETDKRQILNSKNVSVQEWSVMERVKGLSELGVKALICGGIDGFSAQQLSLHGIRVYSWITGEAEDALAALIKGELESGLMMAPGGRCCGRWQFGDARSGRRRRGRGRQGFSPISGNVRKGGDSHAKR